MKGISERPKEPEYSGIHFPAWSLDFLLLEVFLLRLFEFFFSFLFDFREVFVLRVTGSKNTVINISYCCSGPIGTQDNVKLACFHL